MPFPRQVACSVPPIPCRISTCQVLRARVAGHASAPANLITCHNQNAVAPALGVMDHVPCPGAPQQGPPAARGNRNVEHVRRAPQQLVGTQPQASFCGFGTILSLVSRRWMQFSRRTPEKGLAADYWRAPLGPLSWPRGARRAPVVPRRWGT